jgi:sugar phosphate isomerase/epimerase
MAAMLHLDRRLFLRSALAAGAGVAVRAEAGRAIEPIRRTDKAHLRPSIAAYSYNRHLGREGRRKPTMTLDDFIDLAVGMGLDAVEFTEYYFPETTPTYLAHLKGKCTRLGLDVSGTAIKNDFCTPDPAKLKEQIAHVKRWVEHSSRLGAKTIRIFAGSVAKGDSEEKARARCVEAIEEACDHAGRYGIFLALENHGGITRTGEQTLAIVRAVRHDWFGVNWDTGNFHTEDPYADLALIVPYAVTVQIKTEVQRPGKERETADLARLTGMLRSVNYRGYVALEYEAAEDPRQAIPGHIAALQRLMG